MSTPNILFFWNTLIISSVILKTMLGFEEMIVRLLLAVALGALVGIERELAGKAAGIRTDVMVAGGAAIFAMIGLSLPYLVGGSVVDAFAIRASAFSLIANVVVGVGFLGAGIIIQHGTHVYGVTTAATIWLTAAIGILCGVGLTSFAIASSIIIVILLAFFRRFDIQELFSKRSE